MALNARMHESRSCSLSFAVCFSIAFCKALFCVAVGLGFSDCATAVSGPLSTGSLTWWTSGGALAATICSGSGALAGFGEDDIAGAFTEVEAGDDLVTSRFSPFEGAVEDGVDEASAVACGRDLKRERSLSKCLPIALALP